MNYCKHCGSDKLDIIEQTFKDGTKHHRINCASCGQFNGYAKQHNGFDSLVVKDFMFKDSGSIDDLSELLVNKLMRLHDKLKGHNVTITLKAR